MKRCLCLFLCLCLLPGMMQAEEWQQVRHDPARDIRVYLRATADSSYSNFYAVTRAKTRLSTVVAVLSDVPAMPEWIARMRSVKLLKKEADRELWVYGVYRLPYPFLERDAVLHSVLSQDRNGVVEIITRSVNGLVPAQAKRVRLSNMRSTWRLTPEAQGMVKIEMWGQGEPGGYVPPLLFNYNLPDEPAQTLKHLRQMLQRDKYRNRILPSVREPGI